MDSNGTGSSLLDAILLGPKLLLQGINRSVDGLAQVGQYPPNYNAIPMNPNDPRYNNYGVPFNGSAPGTVPGPGSGFMSQPVFGSVTGGQVALGIAALIAIALTFKAMN